MPKKEFALEKGGEKRLLLSWKAFWKEFTVTLDGQVIGTVPGQKELVDGREFTLPEGDVLRVQLSKKVMSPGLQVTMNGEPLPGSDFDPGQRLKVTYGIVFFIGGFNILLGIIGMAARIEILQQMGIGVVSLVVGVVFVILGYFIMKLSLPALVIAIAVLILDTLLTLVFSVQAGGNTPVAGLALRVIFLIFMFQGINAVKALKGREG